MPKLNEDLLQFIWQHKLFKPLPMFTISGKKLDVLKQGERNSDSGPDFFNARIRFDGLTLAGNIEVHVRSSDWLKHGHQNDSSYNTIILHVVYVHDKDLAQNKEHHVEVLELKNYIEEVTLSRYSLLSNSHDQIPCKNQLKKAEDFMFSAWLERMCIERLERKVEQVERLFISMQENYTQTFFILLLRNFGFKVNALPFEMLGRHLDVSVLLRHSDDHLKLEALLFGTAGLLNNPPADEYVNRLVREYSFLKHKYRLGQIENGIFKYSRLRPSNFPDMRLAQFAALIYKNARLLQAPQLFTAAESLAAALAVNAGPYWNDHYRLGVHSKGALASLGKSSIEGLLINSLAPYYFFYSRKQFKPEYRELALQIYHYASFEKNRKTKLFSDKKHMLNTAADSQACIELYDQYCKFKRCLHCGIAANLLKPEE